MVLEAVLFGSHHVPALVLRYLDLPLPGGGGGPRVNVDVDGVTGVGGGHEHVLAGVVATDGGRDGAAGVGDGQGVRYAVSINGANSDPIGGGGVWIGQNHGVKIYPQFADVRTSFAEGVCAGVRVRGD